MFVVYLLSHDNSLQQDLLLARGLPGQNLIMVRMLKMQFVLEKKIISGSTS